MSRASSLLTPEQRFQLFLDAACDYAIFFTDTNGNVQEWSGGAEKILGFSENEALRLNGRDIFLPDDRARGVPEQEMETAAREGQANDERWHVRKDGGQIFVMGRMIALRDDRGELRGYAKILRDTTPRKRLELALHASDEQFRATFGQAPIGMALTDLRGRIQQVNPALCELSGYSAQQLEGRMLWTLAAPPDRDAARGQFEALLTGSRSATVSEKRLLRADGSATWVQNSATLLRDMEGQPLSFIDLFQDISALKRSAAELEAAVLQRTAALESKSRQMEAFCYTVAHDLRAPLRAIAGYAEFLRADFGAELAADALEYVAKIEASAARLDRLISDLLGYTRMQQVPLIREEVELAPVLDKVLDQALRDYRGPRPDVAVVQPLGRVHADAVTLEHVFLNLISNALKFHRPGVPPAVRIRTERRDGRSRVWVEDNGIGIDPRFGQRVFGMFERLHPELEIPGTGVGLAIVATAMERLGGDCGVEPNEPAGSRFWIEFPA